MLSGGKAGAHGLQGIGAGFVPGVLDTKIYDEVICVTEEEAYETGRKRSENAGKTIVALLPDSGDRYLSTPLFSK